MKPYERKQLLERIRREGSTVGASIPETVDLQGEPFELREFVFEVKKADGVPADEREEVQQATRLLRRERLQRKQRIETADITREEGERLVEEIIGIDRALNALESLGSTDLEREAAAQDTADKKRWITFLRKALGRETGRRR